MTDADFSVLISVYSKENPEYLKEALNSIWEGQSLKPKEIVLVEDGPLTDELEKVISDFSQKAPLKILKLITNSGLGVSLAEGLKLCSCNLVARMDSDDISKPDRFEKQVRFMSEHPEVGVLGAFIAEFIATIQNIVSYRKLPVEYSDIKHFAKKRNPLNHMTVIFRKKLVLSSGNYVAFYGYEDYYLWVRLLKNNVTIVNLPDILVYARINNIYGKRRGLRLFAIELKLQKEFLKLGFTNYFNFLYNIIFRALPRLLPVGGLKLVYKFLRN
jgi:glycosyltransferase involved in cell wall biosynthesis